MVSSCRAVVGVHLCAPWARSVSHICVRRFVCMDDIDVGVSATVKTTSRHFPVTRCNFEVILSLDEDPDTDVSVRRGQYHMRTYDQRTQ